MKLAAASRCRASRSAGGTPSSDVLVPSTPPAKPAAKGAAAPCDARRVPFRVEERCGRGHHGRAGHDPQRLPVDRVEDQRADDEAGDAAAHEQRRPPAVERAPQAGDHRQPRGHGD